MTTNGKKKAAGGTGSERLITVKINASAHKSQARFARKSFMLHHVSGPMIASVLSVPIIPPLTMVAALVKEVLHVG